MKTILWLPSWYPNHIEPYSGDFIQRHARAVALKHRVHVLLLVRDREGLVTKTVLEEQKQQGNLTETIIYYYSPRMPITVIDRMLSGWKFRKLFRNRLRALMAAEEPPVCSHVHIAARNSLLALWLNKTYNLPIVVSEHWTAYLPEAIPNVKQFGRLFTYWWQRLMNRASALSVVSRYLGDAIATLHPGLHPVVIPNVVDNRIFYPVLRPPRKQHRFVHISTLGYQKNPEAILKAFAAVNQVNTDFRLDVFGPEKEELHQLSSSLGLADQVLFHTEVPQPDLAACLQQADALILYSRYETFGCVIIEANACGVPVIVSNIPVFHELVSSGQNGFFVEGDNAAALAQAILQFMKMPKTDAASISAATIDRYSYEKVAAMFSKFYRDALPESGF